MKETKIKNVKYDNKSFDYRDVFLVDDAGNPDKTEIAKFATAEVWNNAQIEQTKEDFADIDYNNMTSEMSNKIQAIAETVLTKVKRSVKVYNPVPLFFSMEKGQLGKTIEAHEIEGGKVYSFTYGGGRRISSLKHETFSITTTPKAVHFALPVEQLKTGRYTTADLVFAATQAILRDKVSLSWNTMIGGYPTGGGHATNNSGTPIAKTPLDTAIDAVADYDVSTLSVIGRYSVLSSISDFAGSNYQNLYADSALEEIRKRGFLQNYRGADIIRLKYLVDSVYGTEPFGTASVFVVSNEKAFNRYVEVTGLNRRAWVEPSTGTFHMIFEYEDGAAIWKPEYGHRIYGIA